MPDKTRAHAASKRDAALDLARRGFNVFPLIPNGKIPLISGWQSKATTDPIQIAQWWTEEPQANIGVATERLLVVDIDPRKGGGETMKALRLTEDFPETLVSATAGGGAHIIFTLPDGETVAGGTNKLGQGIDIKAHGGLIVAPGSTIDGKVYRWFPDRGPDDIEPAEAPQWIRDQCSRPVERSAQAGQRVAEETQESIDRAEWWLAKHAPEAVEGERDNTAFKVAAKLYDFGVTPETCREYLLQWNEGWCHPPLDTDAIERLVASAAKNRQTAIGSRHDHAPGFEPFEITPRPESALLEPTPPASALLTLAKAFDPAALPLRPWIVPGFACRGRVSMLAGPGGVAKSTYSIMLAVAAAAGRDDICGFKVPVPVRAAVWNQEDDIEEMQRRLAAIMSAYNVSWDDIGDRLFLNSGVEHPLMLAHRTLEGTIRPSKDAARIAQEVKAAGIGLLILDPLVELHEAVENDNVQMRSVVSIVREIAVRGDCAVLLDTHTKKPPVASSDGFAGEMDAARGASSQFGVIRIGATLFSASAKDAKKWRMTGSHLDYVRLDIAKNNLARRTGEPIWFKRDSVRVGGFDGGEDVGLLRPIDLQKARNGQVDTLEAIATAIKEKLTLGAWYSISALLPHLPAEIAADLKVAKNRSRTLNTAFGGEGITEYWTNLGTLTRSDRGGNTGTVLCLQPAPHAPQNSDEEQPSD